MSEPVRIVGATMYCGDCREVLRFLPEQSVQSCVTSPPYFGLRDYGVDGQIGLEPSPDEYVAEMVAVFREVHRVMRDDGTLWLNLGDSYANDAKWGGSSGGKHVKALHGEPIGRAKRTTGLKPKDLIGIPWRVAFALQADGWYLRSAIIWHKPNPMPESVRDRPTKSHETVFLLSKSEKYYFGQEDLKEEVGGCNGSQFHTGKTFEHQQKRASVKRGGFNGKTNELKGREAFRAVTETRNVRSVWPIPTQPCKEAHFAVMVPALAERCIKGGSPAGGIVLDPFSGAGTTALVADRLQRQAIGIELNPEYHNIACERIRGDVGLMGETVVYPKPELARQELLI